MDPAGAAIPTGAAIPAGSGGVRFTYHPGDLRLRDDSGLLCERCWDGLWPETTAPHRECAVCRAPVGYRGSLHVRRLDEPDARQLCLTHAVELLNRLRTVEPKLDPATFRLPMLE